MKFFKTLASLVAGFFIIGGGYLWTGRKKTFWLVLSLFHFIYALNSLVTGYDDFNTTVALVLLCLILFGSALHGSYLYFKNPKKRISWLKLLLIYCVVGVSTELIDTYKRYEWFSVPGTQMLPNIQPRGYVIVDRNAYSEDVQVEIGDLVAFDYPKDRSTMYLQRVFALPGDKVWGSGERLKLNDIEVKQAFFEGPRKLRSWTNKVSEDLLDRRFNVFQEELAEKSYLVMRSVEGYRQSFKEKVPDGHYFLLTDNRSYSFDSRVFGAVPLDHINGKVLDIVGEGNLVRKLLDQFRAWFSWF